MKSEHQIKQLAKEIRFKPDVVVDERILACAEAVLEKSTINQDAVLLRRPSIWRIIMKSPVTKLAAAAVIIIVVGIFLYTTNNMVPAAYALQDTIKAYNSIASLHIKISDTVGLETRPDEVWLECDRYGNMSRVRYHAPDTGQPYAAPFLICFRW